MITKGCTYQGPRQHNEDSYGIFKLKDAFLFIIADGLGGHSAGKIASNMAVNIIKETASKLTNTNNFLEILNESIRKANYEIFRIVKEKPEYSGMGSTVVVALVKGNKAAIANVGDSRAYLVNNTEIIRVTKDHSLVQSLLDIEAIDEEEAFDHPQKNIVLQSLGSKEELKADFYRIIFKAEDILFICSDGLTDTLKEEEIKEVVLHSQKEDICKNLLEAAKIKARDNITIIVACMQEHLSN